MDATLKNIQFERRPDGLAVVTVFRPPVNPLNAATLAELQPLLVSLGNDSTVKGIIFTGWNGILAGADVKEIADLAERPQELRRHIEEGQILTRMMDNVGVQKPLVAALNGPVLGGGCELAMACGVRFIGPKTIVGLPEVNLGLFPGWGGGRRMMALVGLPLAAELVRTGRVMKVIEAKESGWADQVADDPVEGAALLIKSVLRGQVTLRQVSSGPLTNVPQELPSVDLGHRSRAVDALICRMLLYGARSGLNAALGTDLDHFMECAKLEDFRIGLRNFVENGPKCLAQFVHR